MKVRGGRRKKTEGTIFLCKSKSPLSHSSHTFEELGPLTNHRRPTQIVSGFPFRTGTRKCPGGRNNPKLTTKSYSINAIPLYY